MAVFLSLKNPSGMEMTFHSFNAVLMIPLVSKINPHIIETATIEVTTGI